MVVSWRRADAAAQAATRPGPAAVSVIWKPALKLERCAGGAKSAEVKEADPVAENVRLLHHVSRENEDAILLELLKNVPQAATGERIKAAGRLV